MVNPLFPLDFPFNQSIDRGVNFDKKWQHGIPIQIGEPKKQDGWLAE